MLRSGPARSKHQNMNGHPMECVTSINNMELHISLQDRSRLNVTCLGDHVLLGNSYI